MADTLKIMARISQLPFLPCSLTKLEPTFHTFLLARNILVIYIPCTIAVCTLRELQQNFQIEFANFLLCHRKIDFCSDRTQNTGESINLIGPLGSDLLRCYRSSLHTYNRNIRFSKRLKRQPELNLNERLIEANFSDLFL